MKRVLFSLLSIIIYIPTLNAQCLYPQNVTEALGKAGKNKISLENVLKHYKNDTERYAAACYLIANMPLHKQAGVIKWCDPQISNIIEQNDANYYNLIKNTTDAEQECDPLHGTLKKTANESANRIKRLKLQEPNVYVQELPDITNISGSFIQEQIDHAFSLRNRMPRLKKMPLNDFFEYILAYRAIPDYPLVTDNQILSHIFSKYLQVDTTHTARCLAERYNRAIWWLNHFGGTYPFDNSIGWKELFFTNTGHDCVDIANYAALAFRACGWPAAVEYNIAYKIYAGKHFDLSLPASDWGDNWQSHNNWQSFSPQSELPSEAGNRFKNCLNIYRLHFASYSNNPVALKSPDEIIPQELKDPCIEDVSHLYTSTVRLELPLPPNTIPIHNQLVYLASFSPHIGLTIVTWGKISRKNNVAIFDNVIDDNIYFPVFITNDHKIQPFAEPFRLDRVKAKGTTITPTSACYHTIHTHAPSKNVKVTITRKFPRKPNLYKIAQQAVGTYIIASNTADFMQADTLATIDSAPNDIWTDIPLHPQHPYQYYRVCAPKSDPHLHLAEIQFLSLASRAYHNTIAPTHADSLQYHRLMDEPLEKCCWKAEYDGNYQTAPDNWPNVTLKLQQPQYVDCLHFMIKNADNHVRPQHFYTLYQWTNKAWSIVCQGEATGDTLPTFLLHTNQLYWLSDLTEGNEELPFSIDCDGHQVFPHEWLLTNE